MTTAHPDDRPEANLVTAGDIARASCVNPETARRWTHKPDFPVPRRVVGPFRLWGAAEVAAWTAASGHPQRIHRTHSSPRVRTEVTHP